MDLVFGLLLGIGLAAAAGFRLFVPLLGMSLATLSGRVEVAAGFEWLANPWIAGVFGVATVLEVGAYFIPWLDNALDTLASPAAVVAGTVMTASLLGTADPWLQWMLGVIAGGGVAATVQGTSVAARGTSSVTTAGVANPIVAFVELVASVVTTVLALIAPVVAVVLVGVAMIWLFRRIRRGRRAGGQGDGGASARS